MGITVSEIRGLVEDALQPGDDSWAVVCYTVAYKEGKGAVAESNIGERVPALGFDVVGPLEDADKDVLTIKNNMPHHGVVVVVEGIPYASKRSKVDGILVFLGKDGRGAIAVNEGVADWLKQHTA